MLVSALWGTPGSRGTGKRNALYSLFIQLSLFFVYLFFSVFLNIYLFFIEGWLLCRILLFSVKAQHESATGILISPLIWNSLPSPSPPHPSRLIMEENGFTVCSLQLSLFMLKVIMRKEAPELSCVKYSFCAWIKALSKVLCIILTLNQVIIILIMLMDFKKASTLSPNSPRRICWC